MYTDELLERIQLDQTISDDGYKVLDGTIGEYLEHYDNDFKYRFITFAIGKYLDLHGREYGLIRKVDESDAEFRKRIMVEKTIVESSADFVEKLGVDLYSWNGDIVDELDDVSSGSWHLVSRNQMVRDVTGDYLWIGSVDEESQAYLESKFLTGDIVWL